MAANCGVHSARATVNSRSGGLALAAAPAVRGRTGGLRTSSAAGMISSQEKGPNVNIAMRQP
jgi:hypothetical protein